MPAINPSGDALAAVARDAAAGAGGASGTDPDLLGTFLADLAEAVTAGGRLRAAQCRRYRARGQEAARRGVALRALLQLYLSAAWRLWPLLPEARTEDPALPASAAQTVLRALDDTVAAVTEGFQLARRGLVREQESARREFIDDLLTGQADVAGLVRRAAGFGMDLSAPHAVAIVRADQPFSDTAPLTGIIERAVQGSKGDADVLVASKDGALVVVFAAPDRGAVGEVAAQITAVLRPPSDDEDTVDLRRRAQIGVWRLGVGRAGPGPTGVRASYQEAREALDTAARIGLDGPVIDSADMPVYRVLLRDRPAITELVETMLGPLEQARGGAGPLLDTLGAYLECGANAVQTGRRLNLSVRAVTYRLERVARLTGHDPAQPGQRFALHAAVLGAKLLGWRRN